MKVLKGNPLFIPSGKKPTKQRNGININDV